VSLLLQKEKGLLRWGGEGWLDFSLSLLHPPHLYRLVSYLYTAQAGSCVML
jgi:hypothetical protein